MEKYYKIDVLLIFIKVVELMNKNVVNGILRFLFLVVVIILSFIFIYYTAKVTYPFIIAFIVAFLMNPIVNLFEHKLKINRLVSVLITMLLIILVFAGLVTILVIEAINGVAYLVEHLPSNFQMLVNYLEEFFVTNILPFYNQLLTMFHNLDPSYQNTIVENIQATGAQLTEGFKNAVQALAAGFSAFVMSLPNFATGLIISILATFFISKDWYAIRDGFKKIIPEKAIESGGNVYSGLKTALFGFVKAQFTLISITAVIVLIGLFILRVDYAITIALIIGLVDLLPYLGTGLIFIPWIIYMFFTENYFLTIGLSVLYGIVLIQRQIMEPKVLSSNIGLKPLPTLIALFVGFKLFGFLGLILGPALLVVGKTLYNAGVFEQAWQFIKGKPN